MYAKSQLWMQFLCEFQLSVSINNFEFPSNLNLKRHILSSHIIQVYSNFISQPLNKKDHKCDLSHKSCVNSKNLKQHINNVHSGKINENCSDCENFFMDSCILKIQVKKFEVNIETHKTEKFNKCIPEVDSISSLKKCSIKLSKSSNIYKDNVKVIPAKFPAQFLPFGLENFDVLDAQNSIDIFKTL